MQFELNEIEARREQYPSTISFLNLLNALIAEERDVSDRGRRYWSLFAFCFFCILICLSCILTLILMGSSLSLADSLASLGSYMIMFLGRFLTEPMQIPVRNGNWLSRAFSIFICEYILQFQFLMFASDFGCFLCISYLNMCSTYWPIFVLWSTFSDLYLRPILVFNVEVYLIDNLRSIFELHGVWSWSCLEGKEIWYIKLTSHAGYWACTISKMRILIVLLTYHSFQHQPNNLHFRCSFLSWSC